MPNRFIPIGAGTDPAQQTAIMNQNFAQLDNESVTKAFYSSAGKVSLVNGQLPNDLGSGALLYDANGVPIIAMYIDAAGNPVFKVAKPGQDATTATGTNLYFNSSQNMLKIVSSGAATVTTPDTMTTSTAYTTTVAHGLGFAPAFLAYVTTPSSAGAYISGAGSQIFGTPYNLPISIGTYQANITAQVRADATNLYFDVWNYQNSNIPSLGGNWVFRYYLMQETAN